MYCKECGAKIKDESKFCPKCGAKIVAVPPRHAAPDSRVPLIVRGGVSSHDKASTSSQTNGQAGKASLVSSQETSDKHPDHESKHVIAKVAIAWIALIVVAFAVVWNTRGFFSTVSNSTVSAGNTVGNIVNGGLAAKQGNSTYFMSTGSAYGWSIKKISADGSDESTILSAPNAAKLCDLNIVDDEMYFVSTDVSTAKWSIMKAGTDGANESTILSASVVGLDDLTVIGDKAYFIDDDASGSYSIREIDTDGEKVSTVWSAPTKTELKALNVINDEMYFVSETVSGSTSLCKVATDGSNEKTVYKGSVEDPNVVDGEVYFLSKSSSDYSICRVDLDGKNESTIWSSSSPALEYLNVVGDEMYFVNNIFSQGTVCKVGIDGSGEKVVWWSTNGEKLSVAGDEMYFLNSDNNFIYKVGTDGTNGSKV